MWGEGGGMTASICLGVDFIYYLRYKNIRSLTFVQDMNEYIINKYVIVS